MHLRHACAIAVSLHCLSSAAQAGPLKLLLRNDSREIGLNEFSRSGADASLAVGHPATLAAGAPGEAPPPSQVEFRYLREFTYRRTAGQSLTRVASGGTIASAIAGPDNSSWRVGAQWQPKEFEKYFQQSSASRTDLNGGFDAWQFSLGKKINSRTSAGFTLSEPDTNLPLGLKPFDAGDAMPNVSGIQGSYDEKRWMAQVQHSLSKKHHLRLGYGRQDGDVNVSMAGDVGSTGQVETALLHIPASGSMQDVAYRYDQSEAKSWVLSYSHENTSGTGTLGLLSGAGLGPSDARLKRQAFALTQVRRGDQHTLTYGLEHTSGDGDIGFTSALGPLFPNGGPAASGTATARAAVNWESTLARVGYLQQVNRRLQGRAGLAFGRVAGEATADANARLLFGLFQYTYDWKGELGPRLGLMPNLGLDYQGKRLGMGLRVSQFIPLPDNKKGDDGGGTPSPNPSKPKTSTFGGNLVTFSARYLF